MPLQAVLEAVREGLFFLFTAQENADTETCSHLLRDTEPLRCGPGTRLWVCLVGEPGCTLVTCRNRWLLCSNTLLG